MVYAASFFILAGTFFFFAGVVGMLRFPDFFSRMHATGKGDTLGTVCMLAGIALCNLDGGFTLANILVSVKLMLIGVFWFLALPVWGHGTPAEQAGYVMADAYARDQAAWKLARSDNPLWTAFRNQRRQCIR